MYRKTRLTRSEALRIREQGLSLAKIANRFGVTKQYIHKLLKSEEPSTPPSTDASTENVKQLTPRQRRFAKGLAEGKTQKAAALAAVEPGQLTDRSAEQWASTTVRNPKFRRAFRQILDDNGLGDEDLARIHQENLQATKVVGFDEGKDGEKVPILHPDYATRQRAVDGAWRLRGRVKPENEETPSATLEVLMVTEAERRLIEKSFMGGERLPDECVRVLPGAVVDGFAETDAEVCWEGDETQ